MGGQGAGWMGAGVMLASALAAALTLQEQPAAAAPAPVPELDLSRYAGLWYEIAVLPDRFHVDCADSAVTVYTPQAAARLAVENRCRAADGTVRRLQGQLRVKAPGRPGSRLEVRYAPAWLAWLPLAWSEVWVIALAPDYRHAVAATPDREHLWILSRTPTLAPGTYDSLLAQVRAQGFATQRLQRIPQGAPPGPGPDG